MESIRMFAFLTSIWFVLRQFKGIIFDYFYTFGMSYMIFLWYRHDWQRGVEVATKGFLWSVAIFCLYGLLDGFLFSR